MKYGFLLLILPWVLHATVSWKADVQKPFEVNIQFSSSRIPINGSLSLEAHIYYPSSYELQTESLLDSMIKSANPLNPEWNIEHPKVVSLPTHDVEMKQLQAIFYPLAAGILNLPSLHIRLQPKDREKPDFDLFTPNFIVEVTPSVKMKSLPLAPLIPLEPQFPLGLTEANRRLFIDNPKEIEEEKKRIQTALQTHSFPWLMLAILLGISGIGWSAYLTKERWLKKETKTAVALSSKEQIQQAFADLHKKQLLEQEKFQEYYVELSAILSHSLQTLMGGNKKGMTTQELIDALKKSSFFSNDQKEKVSSLLVEIDQIKFAGKPVSQQAAHQIFQEIQNLVEKSC